MSHHVRKTVRVQAPVSEVWQALTDPKITKKYFFGCEAHSDWEVGSSIEWRTNVNGQDVVAVKGVILAVEPHSLLENTCFMPENEGDPAQHTTVRFEFSAEDGATVLNVNQGPFAEESSLEQHENNWDMVLRGLKALLERES